MVNIRLGRVHKAGYDRLRCTLQSLQPIVRQNSTIRSGLMLHILEVVVHEFLLYNIADRERWNGGWTTPPSS